MKRYELRPRGVFDRETGEALTPESPGWQRYEAWLAQGNAPALPADPTIEERRAAVRKRANGARVRALERLVVSFEGRFVRADDASLAALSARVALGGRTRWRAEDNLPLELDADGARRLLAAMVAAREALLARAWRLKDETIAGSRDPESIDLEAGMA